MAYKKILMVAHKMLEEGSDARLEQLTMTYPDIPIVGTSILDDVSLDKFKRAIFDGLHIMRVYTKQIGHDADFNDPIILHPGATVEEAALHLHKDFAHKLQFAKIWGAGKFDGQRVTKSFVLTDGDDTCPGRDPWPLFHARESGSSGEHPPARPPEAAKSGRQRRSRRRSRQGFSR